MPLFPARTIRTRVLAIVLIPCLGLLAVGLGGAGYLVSEGSKAKDYADRLQVIAGPSGDWVKQIQEERRITLLAMAGDQQARSQLAATRAKSDQASVMIGQIAQSVMELNPEGTARTIPVLSKYMAQFPEVRQKVDAGQIPVQDVYTFFNQLSDVQANGLADLATTYPDSRAAVQGALNGDIGQALEGLARGNAYGAHAIAAGGLTAEQLAEYRLQTEGYHAQLIAVQGRLPAKLQEHYTRLSNSDPWQQLKRMEAAIIERGPRPSPTRNDNRPLPLSMADWQQAAIAVSAEIAAMWSEQYAYGGEIVAATGERTYTRSMWGGAGVLAVTAVAMLIALQLSNRLVRRLKRLRGETLEIAERRLPELVSRLRRGTKVDLDKAITPLDHGQDEIGQVADAFNKAQRTAAAAAVQEAETREGVNAVFLNIAYRNQVVVHRQLEVLDQAERREEDPDQLELLFKVDHLATRSRRNAENLIILGGAQPGRQWRNPVQLMEVVRSAVGETEDYARVRIGRLPTVAVQGMVVADLVHLLAELVDNATSFSPPESRVEVRGNVVGTGVVIEVEDQGLGITEEEREAINESLHNPPDFRMMSLSTDARLGLFVVAKLADRHGISVTIAESAYGGTRAIVLIRSPLLAKKDGEEAPDLAETAVIGAQRPREGGLHRSMFEPVRRPAEPPRPAEWPAEEPPEPAPRPSPAPEYRPQRQPQHAREEPGTAPDDDRPPLPRRRRQASLAPQLAATVTAPGNLPVPQVPEPDDDYSPERARDVFGAFQRGTRRARDE